MVGSGHGCFGKHQIPVHPKLQNPPEGSVVSLDAFHKRLGELGGSGDVAKAAAANFVQGKLDEFLQTAGEEAVVPGTPAAEAKAADETLYEANGNTAARKRSDRVTGLEESAELRANAANSGRNFDNATRQRLVSFLDSAKKTRGLSSEEIAAIEDIVEGCGECQLYPRKRTFLAGMKKVCF